MTARVTGLGHVGIYVQDLDAMTAFYRDFMGMTVTKRNDSMAFFSADPYGVDHEIALMKGRPGPEDPHLINQISLRVNSLDDLRDFHDRVKERGFQIEQLVCHASAIGCYFRDPENNVTEVFWVTGLTSWAPVGVPIDIDRPDQEVLDEVYAIWQSVRHVEMGSPPDAETQAMIRDMVTGARAPAS